MGTRSRFPGAVRGLRPRNTGSAPSWSACAGILDDAARLRLTLRTGQSPVPSMRRSSSASTPGSRPTPGVLLPGTLASPRTGLAPAGCRELVARLRLDAHSGRISADAAFPVGLSIGLQVGSVGSHTREGLWRGCHPLKVVGRGLAPDLARVHSCADHSGIADQRRPDGRPGARSPARRSLPAVGMRHWHARSRGSRWAAAVRPLPIIGSRGCLATARLGAIAPLVDLAHPILYRCLPTAAWAKGCL